MLCIGSVYAWSIIAYELIEKYGVFSFPVPNNFWNDNSGIPCYNDFCRTIGQKKKAPVFRLHIGPIILFGIFLASYSQGSFILILLGIGLLGRNSHRLWLLGSTHIARSVVSRKKGFITGIAAAGFGLGAVFMSEVSEIILNNGYNVLQLLKIIGISYGLIILCFLKSHLSNTNKIRKYRRTCKASHFISIKNFQKTISWYIPWNFCRVTYYWKFKNYWRSVQHLKP
jgi:MFS transporter, OFA family, oxalate/formate antiporter